MEVTFTYEFQKLLGGSLSLLNVNAVSARSDAWFWLRQQLRSRQGRGLFTTPCADLTAVAPDWLGTRVYMFADLDWLNVASKFILANVHRLTTLWLTYAALNKPDLIPPNFVILEKSHTCTIGVMSHVGSNRRVADSVRWLGVLESHRRFNT